MNPPRALDPETHLPFPKPDLKWTLANWFLEKWGRKFTLKLLQIINPFVNTIVGTVAHTEASSQIIGTAIGAAVLGGIDVLISFLTHGKVKSLQKIQEEAEAEQYDDEPVTQRLSANKVFIDDNPTLTNIKTLAQMREERAAYSLPNTESIPRLPRLGVGRSSKEEVSQSPFALMNCQHCGEFQGHGHECYAKPQRLGLGEALGIKDTVKPDEAVVEFIVDGVTQPRKYFTDRLNGSVFETAKFRAENYVSDQDVQFNIQRKCVVVTIYQPGDVLP